MLLIVALPAATKAQEEQEQLEWKLAPELRFSHAELAAAISARSNTPAEELACAPLEVRLEDAQRVLAMCGTRAQVVDLGSRSGADAARLVALVLLDLAHSKLSPQLGRMPPNKPQSALPAESNAPVHPSAAAKTHKPPTAAPVARQASELIEVRRSSLKVWGAANVGLAIGFQHTDTKMSSLGGAMQLWRAPFFVAVGFAEQRTRFDRGLDVPLRSRLLHVGVGRDVLGSRASIEIGVASNTALKLATYQEYSVFAGTRVERAILRGLGTEFTAWLAGRAFQRRASFALDGDELRTTPIIQVSAGLAFRWRFGTP